MNARPTVREQTVKAAGCAKAARNAAHIMSDRTGFDKGNAMTVNAVLTNPHVTDHWTPAELSGLDLAGDETLAEFVAAAPDMARALKAILSLDLGHDAERLVRAEIRYALH